MDDPQRRGAVVNWVREVGDPWIKVHHHPDPGSSLAADDIVEPRVSELARFSILTSIDHLGMVVDAMESDLPFRHYGPLTALRTVLLAGSRAKWLLSGAKRVERQIRGIMLEIQNQIELKKAFGGFDGEFMTDDLVAGREKAIAQMDEKIDWLRQVAAELRPNEPLKKLPDTASMIDGLVNKSSLEGQGIRHLWRTGSATAHGYHWNVQLSENPEVFDEAWFNTSLYGSMMLVKDSLELYDKRATNWTLQA